MNQISKTHARNQISKTHGRKQMSELNQMNRKMSKMNQINQINEMNKISKTHLMNQRSDFDGNFWDAMQCNAMCLNVSIIRVFSIYESTKMTEMNQNE